jgi:PAT family beta-lactamase induction signal transducer AmpG
VPLRRKLFVIAAVYVVEGFPMGVFVDLWPVFQRRIGMSQAEIGFVAGLSLIWSLKVFWSPLVNRFGERRHWIMGAQLAMAAALIGVADLESNPVLAWIGIAMTLYCVASATQDIAIDAYTIAMLDDGEEGPGNAMRNTGYRVGMVVLANLLLFLPRWIGWSGTLIAAAAVHASMAFCITATPRIEVPPEARREMWSALRRWLSQSGALPVFAFVLLFRVGDSAMAPMIKPFWVDRGFSNEEIASISGMLSFFATLGGAWLAAALVSRIGIGRSLLWTGLLALASNLGYAAAAGFPEAGRAGVYAASVTESFCGGMAGVAFMSFLMRICEKQHAAVQYALLTAIYNLAGSGLKFFSGVMTESLGYAGYFALTGLFALPAFGFLSQARRWLGSED